MRSDATVMEIDREWADACEVQRGFMPHSLPETQAFSYSARCRQLRELGGDCYDFVPLPDNRVAVTVGDASGKGLAAALMISNVQSSLRTAASFSQNDNATVLGAVNRQVHSSALSDRYATLFYGVFEGSTRTLRYVNAGHNPPMVMHRDGSVDWLETGGAPVGIFSDWTYEEETVQLDSGDWLIAYTDGVTEAMNPAGEQWGVDGLRRAAARSAAQSADDVVHSIFTSMDEFSRGCQHDDATVVVMRVH
ncbi:MAG TPA: PP2C family protein-serine/threonine phosphatase [Terriglobia bacterium]|nr:PP2C family protein-serine/threonine phosphatase [Terriglobia bacterium]